MLTIIIHPRVCHLNSNELKKKYFHELLTQGMSGQHSVDDGSKLSRGTVPVCQW